MEVFYQFSKKFLASVFIPISVSFSLLVFDFLSDWKPHKGLLRSNKIALCEKTLFNNHEKQVKTSFFALKTILKKVAEKWRFLKEKVADFGADHLETLKLIQFMNSTAIK